jgi:hypothetical protein
MRRILTAFAIFSIAGGALVWAEAKRPTEKPNEKEQAQVKVKEKPLAKKYLPVKQFGDY